MPFCRLSAHATFNSMINHIVWDMLDVGTIACRDDLMVHAAEKPEHGRILLEVLRRLRNNQLRIAPDKCE